MNRWALTLHIYQPPNQRADILALVAKESYNGLLDFLSTVEAPVTLNVTGSLTEQLALSGLNETLDRLKRAWANPHVTFTDTAYTHPLLPLWPDEVILDQFAQNEAVQRQYLDNQFRGTGAWIPECAWQNRLDRTLGQAGVKWTVIDESSVIGGDYRPAVKLSGGQLRLAVRHRALSQALATDVEQFATILNAQTTDAMVALDGEVFGHFDSQALTRLGRVFTEYGERLVSAEKLVSGELPKVKLRPSTWETSPNDRLRRKAYPLWQDRLNPVHAMMWTLYQDVWHRISENGSWPEETWVKRHFTNAISSCWFWWANPKRTAGPFKMRVWNPDMIVEGLTELIKTVRSDPRLSPRVKWQIETRYADMLKLVWRTHWKLRAPRE